MNTFLSLAFIFVGCSLCAKPALYDFEVIKNEVASESFKKVQKLRADKSKNVGNIFITPEVATRKLSFGIDLKNQTLDKIIAYLCKASNAGYYSDDYGNYYIVSHHESFNRVIGGEWVD